MGVHATWAPGKYVNKWLSPNWGNFEYSCATSQAPVHTALSYDDRNRLTMAWSDALNPVQMRLGLVEETGCLDCEVRLNMEYPVTHYEADLWVDTKDHPFPRALDQVRRWWEGYEGYAPAPVPDAARRPMYSSWYSFHQSLDVEGVLAECRAFADMGCEAVILDHGWQSKDTSRGFSYCGDWEVYPGKIPDMKKFVADIHATGMKCLLWYAVPFVGVHSKAYERFKDKLLQHYGEGEDIHYVVDPRYPDVREFLINTYCQAVRDWDLDGFKLDFVDAFRQDDKITDEMDFVSVAEAANRLLKDVLASLRAIKPDILIEFRQTYIGPLMRTYGNMFRSGDCPHDSLQNQLNTLTIRLTSGESAVHSDMVMWHYDETPELAAFQLNRVFFSVPQISVRDHLLSDGQRRMIRRYLSLWNKYRDTLLDGELTYRGHCHNYLSATATSEDTSFTVVYAGELAPVGELSGETVVINATMEERVLLDGKGRGLCRVYDCCGDLVHEEALVLDGICPVAVPVNGSIVIEKE